MQNKVKYREIILSVSGYYRYRDYRYRTKWKNIIIAKSDVAIIGIAGYGYRKLFELSLSHFLRYRYQYTPLFTSVLS